MRNLEIVKAYGDAMYRKDWSEVEKCLHPDVHFLGPCYAIKGKETMVEFLKKCLILLIVERVPFPMTEIK